MTAPLRLVIFDVDGTLVDSQAHIVSSMRMAFAALGLAAPTRAQILAIVGLSLHVAMPILAPTASKAKHAALEAGYKDAYAELRRAHGAAAASPLYDGAHETLRALHAVPEVLLGVATGKSRRGVDALVDAHGLHGLFVTRQVADDHPSKPHPSMLHTALAETGVAAANAVMVGDTSFDMEMAANAGIDGVGVMWGYHPPEHLTAARRLVHDFDALRADLIATETAES